MEDEEWTALRTVATRQGLTLSAWVRQALAEARREEAGGDAGAKRQALRAATAHRFPTGDIDTMLVDIQRGYADSPS